jgi:DNA-directed RNA polymerase specialized sigma24 family protein
MFNIPVEQWIKNHQDHLLALTREKISNPTTALRIVEETFQTALASQAAFSNEKAQRKWLTAILHNKINDWLAKNSPAD